jgi:CheY-like chemotaxis protein
MEWPGNARQRLRYTLRPRVLGWGEATMKSVLVVDDNELVRNLIKVVLVNGGFDVILAASGHEAIQMLNTRDDSIACVLQDLSLSDMPGEKVVAEMLKMKPGLPIIILTVDDVAACASRLSGLDIVGHVQKPFDSNALVERVAEIVDVNRA